MCEEMINDGSPAAGEKEGIRYPRKAVGVDSPQKLIGSNTGNSFQAGFVCRLCLEQS